MRWVVWHPILSFLHSVIVEMLLLPLLLLTQHIIITSWCTNRVGAIRTVPHSASASPMDGRGWNLVPQVFVLAVRGLRGRGRQGSASVELPPHPLAPNAWTAIDNAWGDGRMNGQITVLVPAVCFWTRI